VLRHFEQLGNGECAGTRSERVGSEQALHPGLEAAQVDTRLPAGWREGDVALTAGSGPASTPDDGQPRHQSEHALGRRPNSEL
jgi:hypothetical protein